MGRPATGVVTRCPAPAALLPALWLILAGAQAARIAVTGSLMSGDGVYHFAHLRSLVVDRDLDPANEVRHFREQVRSPVTGRPKLGSDTTRSQRTGKVVNKYPVGLALLAAPGYLAVHLASAALSSAGVPVDRSGYGWAYQYACGLMVAAYAVIGLWWCQRVAASMGEGLDRTAWWAALLVAGAMPWLFYATVEPLFSHALSATTGAALAWQWVRARGTDRTGPWLAAGAVGGVAAMVRYQDASLLLLPLADLVVSARAPIVRLRLGLAVGAGAVLALLPQAAANYAQFGTLWPAGYAGETFALWQRPWLIYTLTSADVGLLRWSPIAVGALAGLAIGAWRGWPAARMGLLMVAVQVYLVASWYFVSQGHAFGNRMLVNCTVFFVVGLTALLDAARDRPRLRAGLLAAGVLLAGANLLLMWLWTRGAVGPLAELLSLRALPR